MATVFHGRCEELVITAGPEPATYDAATVHTTPAEVAARDEGKRWQCRLVPVAHTSPDRTVQSVASAAPRQTRDIGSLVHALAAATTRARPWLDDAQVHARCNDLADAIGRTPTTVDAVHVCMFLECGGLNAIADLLDMHAALSSATVAGALALVGHVYPNSRSRGWAAKNPDSFVRLTKSLVSAAREGGWSTALARQGTAPDVQQALNTAEFLTYACDDVCDVETLVEWLAHLLVHGGTTKAARVARRVLHIGEHQQRATHCRNVWTLERAGAFCAMIHVVRSKKPEASHAFLTLRCAAACGEPDEQGTGLTLCEHWVETGFADQVLAACVFVADAFRKSGFFGCISSQASVCECFARLTQAKLSKAARP
jgi:hypothetical protein